MVVHYGFFFSNVTFYGKAFFINNTAAALSLNAVHLISNLEVEQYMVKSPWFHSLAWLLLLKIKLNTLIFWTCAYRTANGGAVHTHGGTTTFEAASTVSFIENTADRDGGAVSVIDSQLIMEGETTFWSNTACERGGALHVSRSELKVHGAHQFHWMQWRERGCYLHNRSKYDVQWI